MCSLPEYGSGKLYYQLRTDEEWKLKSEKRRIEHKYKCMVDSSAVMSVVHRCLDDVLVDLCVHIAKTEARKRLMIERTETATKLIERGPQLPMYMCMAIAIIHYMVEHPNVIHTLCTIQKH